MIGLVNRMCGLVLLALSPALAAWALYVFRRDRPKNGYVFHLRALAGGGWKLVRTGELFNDGTGRSRAAGFRDSSAD